MQRISQRVMEGLCHGEDAMPQFAETKQRVANVIVESEALKPMRSIVHEKCNSKKEAEDAARRLLAENAKYFSSSTSIEADVVCDLEWDGKE